MTKDSLLKKVQELSKQVQESAENHAKCRSALESATNSHNVLVGRLTEAQAIYDEYEENSSEMPDLLTAAKE